jgi:hypothetical protein
MPLGSYSLASVEDRLKRAFSIRGAFPVELLDKVQPVVDVFAADAIGYHSWQGKCFNGQHTLAAGGGASKLCIIPPYAIVLTRLWATNLAGAAGTFTLRAMAPAEASGMGGVLSQTTFFAEGQLGSLTYAVEDAGIVTRAEAAAGALIQPAIWRGVIAALSTVVIDIQFSLPAGYGLCCQDETVAQGIAFAWSGYVL